MAVDVEDLPAACMNHDATSAVLWGPTTRCGLSTTRLCVMSPTCGAASCKRMATLGQLHACRGQPYVDGSVTDLIYYDNSHLLKCNGDAFILDYSQASVPVLTVLSLDQ